MKRTIVSLLIAMCLCVTMGTGRAMAESVDARLIALNNPPALELKNCTEIKPGPPKTLKCTTQQSTHQNYYKLFNDPASATAIENQWNIADIKGILLPAYGVKTVKYKDKEFNAFWSQEVPGTFFQLQKPGKMKPILDWVNKQQDKIVLTRAKSMFEKVRKLLGDAQGFVEIDKPGLNIKFIDINTPGTSPNAETVVSEIEKRLTFLNAKIKWDA
ncbi:MAG: hypothetical protein HC941_04290 [Microcoleus sp. SU_5_3]|nr:hypothetical protein [Microcoleus sp. SU_5_3]